MPQSYSLKLSNLMTDFTESIAFLSIVKIFICRYSPWQIRILQTPALSSPLLILLLFPVNTNECRVLQVSLALRFKFKTDLIINWIYPIKTHGERLGASLGSDHILVPRAHLTRGQRSATRGSGQIHIKLASDWLQRRLLF